MSKDIFELSDEITKVVNRYIEDRGMATEEILGVLCVVGFKVLEASKPASAVSGGENEPT